MQQVVGGVALSEPHIQDRVVAQVGGASGECSDGCVIGGILVMMAIVMMVAHEYLVNRKALDVCQHYSQNVKTTASRIIYKELNF